MRFNSLLRPAAAALLLIAASPARAQDTVSMKLDLVSWGEDIPGLSLKSAGKGTPVTAKAFTYTKPVSYAGSAIMEIHQEGADPEGAKAGAQNPAPIAPELKALREKDPTIVALAKLPLGSKRATVLIAPAQGGTYQTFVIDDDPSKLPLGKLRIHSYAPIRVAVRVQGMKQPVAMKLKDSFLAEPKDGQVAYELAYEKDGAWKKQENNLIPVKPDEQVQMIILKSDAAFFKNSDGSGSGFMQSVTLRRPGKDAPEPAATP